MNPSFKVPWQLTLHVPRMMAHSQIHQSFSERNSSDGMKTVQCRKPTVASYLVALAVGPRISIPAGHAGANNTEIRIITPKGHIRDAKYGTALIPPDIVNLLEKYSSDFPYPYEKLDEVAIHMAVTRWNIRLAPYGSGIILAKRKR